MKNSKIIGLIGEIIASIFLNFKGYKVIKRRYKSKIGEIDLILKKRKLIIFCEVKTRVNLPLNLNTTSGIISLKQRKRLMRSGTYFISKSSKYNKYAYRFDVIIINSFFKLPLHIKNVFW